MLLADQGAEVIKVELPCGESMRRFGKDNHGVSDTFLSSNRGKRSLSINLKTQKGLEIVKQLAKTSDVFIQNFRPGTIERLGLGENTVRNLKPDIIYVSINGVGESGPYAKLRTYDPVIQALSGMTDIQKDRQSNQPHMVRIVIADKITALTSAQAISTALFCRERNGMGQHVKIAMLDAMVAFLWPEGMSSLSYVGEERDPSVGQLGLDLVYKTADRFITAGAVTDAEWVGLCRALNRTDLIEDDRFCSPGDRTRNVRARREITSKEIRTWPSAALLERLRAHDVPCAPVLTRSELLEDPQILHNKLLVIHDDPLLGLVRQPRPAAQFDQTPVTPTNTAPVLGADNNTLLSELGYGAAEIANFTTNGIIREVS